MKCSTCDGAGAGISMDNRGAVRELPCPRCKGGGWIDNATPEPIDHEVPTTRLPDAAVSMAELVWSGRNVGEA